jgi:hypothetical protein
MKSLVQHPTATLTWRKSASTPPDFELVGPEGAFATLAFLNDEHTLARVKTAEGIWTLKHLGVLNPVVTLRELGTHANLAVFHPHALRHGKLEFIDGSSYDWTWNHQGSPGGAFLDPGGRPLVRLEAQPLEKRLPNVDLEQCQVCLDVSPLLLTRSSLLATVGWYLLLFDHLKEKDGATPEFALLL